ncbi:TIGR02652 family protein [Chamaesiphon sp. GL140_3_metabinner_50]|uniref:TIGR02652 family protein n=1 Tax=Chamaesiphon sp. GL140_3_metabinner_50 TaxID=2970812 RepID=UPI0025E0B3AD|nr:TIGR02652 family protein [Chamaesiphon sp. GL140_3_metabinner_50]
MNFALQYPIFGPEIQCPHCRQTISALTLTDTYLCSRHGAFEADPNTSELVHLQSSRHWCLWEGEWYRQHTHPDGIRFEIHDALDRLYTQGYRATKVIIAERYRDLIGGYLVGDSASKESRHHPWSSNNTEQPTIPRLFGLPVEFSSESNTQPCWKVINFDLEKEPGIPIQYPYFRMSP